MGDLKSSPALLRRGTSRRLVEGPPSQTAVFDRPPSTTPLRGAVPLPVPGRNFR